MMNTSLIASSTEQNLARALQALKQARLRLEEVDRARREPLAIVGMGCRFPGGASSPSDYWSLITESRDAIVDVPRDRWPLESFHDEDAQAPGRMRFRQAGFVDGVDRFDAAFFEISPREAERMDPQQRMMLQVAWEALDDAGLDARALAGSRAGVWVGVNSSDYLSLQLRDPRDIDAYTLTGGTGSIVANRLSYLLDLRGPSLTVDTACSTSLVAVHLACQSLRAGECDLAIVGAVNLILSPFTTMAHARGMPFASDHRCKTFDARADGYVRGEGCGALVLKRLSHAQRDGDPIWALIRGSAVNQDGRTNGLTAPNGLSQQEVMRGALAVGPVEPGTIGYLEAHGTGTALGDPIEVEAVQQIYGAGRTRPCALGSVKTNIGHLECAAGIAGLIKVALCVHHRKIPALRGFQRLNPHIELDHERFVIPTTLEQWDAPVRRGAVSSFGAGGTNAHVVLEEAPRSELEAEERGAEERGEVQPPTPAVVLLTARDELALRENARAWLAWCEARGDELPLADIAHTSVFRRTRHEHRLAIRAHDGRALRERLRQWLAREDDDDVVSGRVPSGRARRLVFVCPGQGSQWLGMARDLLEHQAAFRGAIEACDVAIAEHTDWSLLERLRTSTDPLDRIDVVQPTLWAVTVALAAQWRHWGVKPDAVIGHSMGEVAAAAISGALSLSDAARVICRRSRLLLRAAGQGAMLLVGQPRADVERRIVGMQSSVSIAVCNSPGATVVSGDLRALDALEAQLAAENVFHRRIAVDVASHSPQMDPLLAALREALEGLEPRSPEIPMLSTVDLQPIEGERLGAEYWLGNLREPVRFGEATERLLAQGHDIFLELSPHPILCTSIEQTVEAAAGTALVLGSMARGCDGSDTMQRAWAALLVNGHEPELGALVPRRGVVQRLPAYQWTQRELWFCERRWAPLEGVGQGIVALDPARVELEGCCYRLDWIVRSTSAASPSSRAWWLVGPEDSWTRALQSAFESRRVPSRVMDELPASSDPRWAEQPAAVLDLRAPGPELVGVEEAATAVVRALEALRRLQTVQGPSPRLWWLTRGAQDDQGSAPAAAALWGLGRAAAIEQAERWGGLIDVPAGAAAEVIASRVVEALLVDDGEDELRLQEDGTVLVPRIVADTELPLAREGLRVGDDRSVLVAGSRGRAVGMVLRALHERGAGSLLWLDEGGSDPGECTVEGDVDPQGLARRVTHEELQAALAQLEREGRPVRAALRIPARSGSCSSPELDADRVIEALRRDAAMVHALLTSLTHVALEELVLVSTVAASWGSMGMGHVGAAAAQVDALARRHRAAGRACVVLEFTPWADADMVEADAALQGARMGVEPLEPTLALAAIVRAPTCTPGTRAVALVQWERLRMAYDGLRPRPVLGPWGRTTAALAEEGTLREELRGLAPAQRPERLEAQIRQLVADLLRHPPEAVARDSGFFQLGMDSIMALALRRRLASDLGRSIAASAIFEHPTTERLARHLLGELALLEDAPRPEPTIEEPSDLEGLLADARAMSERELFDALALELE